MINFQNTYLAMPLKGFNRMSIIFKTGCSGLYMRSSYLKSVKSRCVMGGKSGQLKMLSL